MSPAERKTNPNSNNSSNNRSSTRQEHFSVPQEHLPLTALCSPLSPRPSSTNPACPTPQSSPAPPTWRTAGCSRCTRGRRRLGSRPEAMPRRVGVRWTLQSIIFFRALPTGARTGRCGTNNCTRLPSTRQWELAGAASWWLQSGSCETSPEPGTSARTLLHKSLLSLFGSSTVARSSRPTPLPRLSISTARSGSHRQENFL